MKAAIATGFGHDIDTLIHMRDDWPTPTLADDKRNDEILVRVLACALAPGDVRVLSGACDWVQHPGHTFPYVVGGDIAGIVVETSNNSTKFRVGDYVVSRFELPGPHGRLAEYAAVKATTTTVCPKAIDPVRACGLTASAMVAKKLVQGYMKQHDRVLVLGASGGVGTSLLQYAKLYGGGYVVAVSTARDLCMSLGADRVIDYRVQNWWEEVGFQKNPFDVVYDMAGGENWAKGGISGKTVHPNGTYIALPPGVQSTIELHSVLDLIKISLQWVWTSHVFAQAFLAGWHPKKHWNSMPEICTLSWRMLWLADCNPCWIHCHRLSLPRRVCETHFVCNNPATRTEKLSSRLPICSSKGRTQLETRRTVRYLSSGTY